MQDSVSVDRDKYLGGSDIPIIMNLSPFKRRFDLLLEKAGYKADEFTGNVYTDYGNTMEPIIRDWINAGLKGDDIFKESKHTREAKDGEPLGVRIHLDGENADTVLEIKTTSHIYECVSDYKLYLVQLLYYMVLTGKENGLLAVYERPEDLNTEFISDKLKLFNIALCDYAGLIQEINEAIEGFLDDLKKVKDNPLITEDELLPQEIPDITARIIAFESQLNYLKNVEQTVKAEKAKLKRVMESLGVKTFKTPNGYRLTLVEDTPASSKTVQELNIEKLKAEHPKLYKKYLEDKTVGVSGKAGYVKITAPKQEGEK